MPRLVGSVHKSWFFQCLLSRRSQEICQVEASCFIYKKHISDRLVEKWHWEFHLLLWVRRYFFEATLVKKKSIKTVACFWLWTLWTKCTSMYYWNYIPNSKSCCSCLYVHPFFNWRIPSTLTWKNIVVYQNITIPKISQAEQGKKNAKRFFTLNKIFKSMFCFAPGGPWINVKVLAAAESKASIWLGFNFRDGLMPLGNANAMSLGCFGWKISVGPLASLVFFGIEKTKGLLVFVDVMRLSHCLFHCCLFRVNQKNKVQKKNVQHEPTICWHGKLSTKWSFTKIEKWHHYQNNTTRGKSNTISPWY